MAGNLHFTYISPENTGISLITNWLLGDYFGIQEIEQ